MTYATDTGSVAVINQTCNIAGYISLPSGALSQRLAYDAANRQMYVTDSVLSKIYEIHGFKVTRVISNVPGAFGITYDPDINGVAVFGYNGNAIYFLVGNHSRLNVSLGAYRAWSIAYSPLVHALAISAVARHCQNGTCQWAERLFLLNSTTGNATHFGFGQPLNPGVSVVDSTSGYLYACESGGYVFVFNLSHPVSTVKRIALTGLSPSCQGLAYSPHNDTVFAVSGTSGTVYGIQGVTLSTQFSIPGGSSLWAVTYDPATHSLYATTGGPVDKIFVVRE
ncbi:MAG: hypothetical protein L3K08_06760 [Thermoplasmata archaeon]|nr:hypothetical protein [Thermoplasmata archaeon]